MVEMVGSGSKGVGVRLFVEGGDVVRKTFDQIGDSGKKMWAEIASGSKQANPALRAVNAVSREVQGAAEDLAAQSGRVGSALSAMGPYGVAAAAALGAVAIAAVRAREAMQWGATLTDQAAALGVSTSALQEFRFVAEDLGASAPAMETTLGALNKVIGAIRTGIGDGKFIEALTSIGFTPDQIASLTDGGDLLSAVADKIAATGDIARATRIADALGIDRELVPALMRGSEAMEASKQKARELGLVLEDDLVRGLDEANREAEIAEQRIGMELRRAFLDAAPAIAAASSALADFIGWARRASTDGGVERLNELMGRLNPVYGLARRGVRHFSDQSLIESLRVTPEMMQEFLRSPSRSSLPPVPRVSAGGTGGAGRRSAGGSSARPEGIRGERYDRIDIVSADEIQRMQLAMQLETARIAKNEQLIAQLERELELRELIDRYTKMGLSADDARLSAELEQSNRDVARWLNEPRTANRGDELRESVAAMDETRQARIDDMRQVWRQGVRAAFTGDLDEFLAGVLQQAFQRGVDSIADKLFDLVFRAFDQGGAFGSGGGGGFDWLGAITSVFSSWGGGGFTPTSDADFFGKGAGGAAAMGKIVQVSVSLDGAKGDDHIRRIAAEGVQQGVQASIELTRRHGEDWRVDAFQMTG